MGIFDRIAGQPTSEYVRKEATKEYKKGSEGINRPPEDYEVKDYDTRQQIIGAWNDVNGNS